MTARPRRQKLLVAFLGIVVALLGLEGLLRLRQLWKYGTARDLMQLVPHEASGLEIPEPGSVQGPIEINSLGFRSPELEQPKPPGRVRLAFLGGSTTYCANVTSNAHVWAQLLTALLSEHYPDVEFDHVNAGVPGYTTVQSLTNLRHRVAPLEPDLVFVYHATNDLTHDSRELAVARGLMDVEEASNAETRWSLLVHLIEKNLVYRARIEGRVQEPLQVDPGELTQGFRANLRALLEEAHGVAPVVAVATFSHRARPEQTPEEQRAGCSSSLYYMPYMTVEAILAGFEACNRVIRQEAQRTGSLLIDGAHAVPGDETHFVDSVHFTDEGAKVMALRMFDALSAAPAFQALVERARERG